MNYFFSSSENSYVRKEVTALNCITFQVWQTQTFYTYLFPRTDFNESMRAAPIAYICYTLTLSFLVIAHIFS